MEEQNTINPNSAPAPTPTPAPASEAEHHEPPAEHKSSNLKSKWPFLVIAVLLVLVGIFGAYFFMNQSKQSQTMTATPTPDASGQTSNQTQSQTTSSPAPTKTAMKSYTSQKLKDISFSGYTLEHPTDWIEKTERDDNVGAAKLWLTKGDYSIYIQQGPMGGAGCIYEGELPEGPVSDKRGKPYVDVEAEFGSIRRTKEDAKTGSAYSFCQKNKEDSSYGSFTSIGAVSYTAPANPDESVLTEMDAIIKSTKEL